MFKEFCLLQEMSSYYTMSTESVVLIPNKNGYQYVFSVDNEKYEVIFYKTNIYLDDDDDDEELLLTADAYEIGLIGPNQFDLTGKGKGATVLGQVILSVRKLIDQVFPHGLTYSGYVEAQQKTYDVLLYNKLLKKNYTRINDSSYINNQLLSHWQKTNDPRFLLCQDSISNTIQQQNVNYLLMSANKNKQRQLRRKS